MTMPIVKEIEIPAEPCCGNCAAWKQTQGLNGECHLLPPVPMFAGFQQMPQVAGLQLNGKLPPQPIILAAFPAVNASNICRQWAPDQPPLADEDAPRPEFSHTEIGLIPGEGLVAVPDCPVEDGAYKLPREYVEETVHIPGSDPKLNAALDIMFDKEAREIEGAKHQDEIATCRHPYVEDMKCTYCGEEVI